MIKQLSTKVVYQNKWMVVREDQVEFENKHQGIYGVVDKDDFTLIIPFDGTHFYLVGQYRYALQEYSWEFPQGKHEGDTTTPVIEIAISELLEETGLVTKNISEIGFFHEAPGYSSQGFHIFLAQDLSQSTSNPDLEEATIEVKKVSVEEFEKMILEGKLRDAPTISAYSLMKIKGLC